MLKIDNKKILFDSLRAKWHEIPSGGNNRVSSVDLLKLSDKELIDFWDNARAISYEEKEWYNNHYCDFLKGKRILDVGSGLGLDTLDFVKGGAHVTFSDIRTENMEVIKRLCNLWGLVDVDFIVIENHRSFRTLTETYDVIMAMGSLHHAPANEIKQEYEDIADRLLSGGKWLQLAYPRSRWLRMGSRPFSEWGKITDGDATPWAEWYDEKKLLRQLESHDFQIIFSKIFYRGKFIWFDLQKL
jgi:SAM-dependent methyltransferase